MIESSTSLNRYDGNDSSTEFDYTFRILDETHIQVFVDNVLLTLATDYSVSEVGNPNGGKVIINTPPPEGSNNVVLLRAVPVVQETTYPEATKFPSSVVERDLDYRTMVEQQLTERSLRSFRLNRSFSVGEEDLTLSANADERASRSIVFSNTGLSLEVGPTEQDTAFVAAQANAVVASMTSLAANAAQSASNAANSAANAESGIQVSENGGSATTRESILNFIGNNVDIVVTHDGANGKVDVEIGVAESASEPFTTGDVKLSYKTVADAGWILMLDQTIGPDCSAADVADDATEDLYTLLWNNVLDRNAPVVGGRGASAAADWGDDKPLRLPRSLGCAMAGAGSHVRQDTGINSGVSVSANALTVNSQVRGWITGMNAVFTLSVGTVTGLVSGTTYVVIEHNSTAVKLASTLANAQNGIPINITAVSANAVWALTHTSDTLLLGEALGYERDVMTSTTLLSHNHAINIATAQEFGATVHRAAQVNATTVTAARGGNARGNNMQPTTVMNVMIKL